MDDLIDRQAAIDALGERPIVWTDDDQYTLGERNQYDIDRLAIETLPSAERVGKWIDEGENSAPICSECKSRALLNYESDYHKSRFCPHCGARMRGEEDELAIKEIFRKDR